MYGFIATDSDKKLIITERGTVFVGQDEARAKQAEREALMSTGFGVVIKKLSTRAASEDVVAVRLQEDLSIPTTAARDRAKLLVKAATKADLVVNGKFEGGAIEDAITVVGVPEPPSVAERKAVKPGVVATRVADLSAVDDIEAPLKPETVTPSAGAGATKRGANDSSKRTVAGDQPQQLELPAATPQAAKRVVTTLAALAGPANRERIASRLEVKLAGRLISAIVAAQLYGFIEENDEGKLVMSDRGYALIGDEEDAAAKAEQHGIMATGFGATIKQMRTHKADVEIVAVRLADDRGLSEGSANERAKVLVKAATDAGLIVNERFNAEVIEDALEAVGEPRAPRVTVKATSKRGAPKAPARQKAVEDGNGGIATEKEGGAEMEPTGPFVRAAAAPLQVVLQVDATKLDASKIGEIIQELRATVVVSTPGS